MCQHSLFYYGVRQFYQISSWAAQVVFNDVNIGGPSYWAREFYGIIWLLTGIAFYLLKVIHFSISALLSPFKTYQEISTYNPYAGYLFAVLIVDIYAVLAVFFAGPLIPGLASAIFGSKIAAVLVSFFTQLPFVPYISNIFTPIGVWLSSSID